MTTTRQTARPRIYLWPTDDPADRIDLSPDVVAFEAHRALEEPLGSWSCTVLPRTAEGLQTPANIQAALVLYRKVGLNNVVSLGFEEDGGIGLGLVSTCNRTVQRAGPNPSIGLTITGAFLAKALVQDSIVFASIAVADFPSFRAKIAAVVGDDDPLIVPFAGAWGPPEPGNPSSRDAVPTFLGQSVKDAIDWVLANAPSMRIPLLGKVAGGTGRPSDYVQTSQSVTTWNDARIWADAISSFQGSIWTFLTSILDADFYEIRLDYMPNGTVFPDIELVVRPKPYDETGLTFAPTVEDPGISWESLRTMVDGTEGHVLTLSDVISESLSYGDQQVFSYYQVTSEYDLIGNPEAQKEGLAYPLVDTWTLPRHGIRTMQAQLTLLAGDIVSKASGNVDPDGELRGQVREFRNRLFNWYRAAPYFEGGRYTVIGRDRYRPGDPILVPWTVGPKGNGVGMRYYCTGVGWAWSYGGHYTCTLEVCRGHNAELVAWVREQILASAPAINPSNYADV